MKLPETVQNRFTVIHTQLVSQALTIFTSVSLSYDSRDHLTSYMVALDLNAVKNSLPVG